MRDHRLGIDIGTARIRIAARKPSVGRVEIAAVAVRDLPTGVTTSGSINEPELVAALIDEMLDELGVRGGRAVCAVGAPAATLRTATLPRMTSLERSRAARLDLNRRLGQPSEGIVIRVHQIEPSSDKYVVGAVSKKVLDSRTTALRKAGLRVCGVDHEGRALTRSFPKSDAVLDVGYERTSLHVPSAGSCTTWWCAVGGETITEGIARDLGIDGTAAEARKRALGTAGAGETASAELVREVSELISSARKSSTIRRVTVVGNGSRIPGLRGAIESANGVMGEDAPPDGIGLETYPADIARAASADWALALGLATWFA
jgi:Tfp pilus assembly PilM family ATPase